MTRAPRVIFFGTPEFAAYILEYLAKNNVNVVAAVTTPEKAQGRGLKTRSSAMQDKAKELGLPVLAPEKIRDAEFIEALKKYDADIFCVVAYKILPKEVFTMPRLGTFNVHTSLLPKYRGAAPMQRALMNGETETGITTFLLDDKIDTGGILLQEKTAITEDETLGELHDDLMKLGATLALETIRGLAAGTLKPKPQDNTLATPAPKIMPEDCILDFNKPSEKVHNQIRSLSPVPGVTHKLISGEKIKIFRSRVVRNNPDLFLEPGVVLFANFKNLYIGTLTEPIEILELQREGKKRMTAEEFLRGSKYFLK
ncbi:MAG TPA: methionyl-tRNA formyltransferase [Candidatus Kapabacteria bacterium]|nr:methionyl-tRNA formyltransferase [Candidatus Kapabacteria bacterium]